MVNGRIIVKREKPSNFERLVGKREVRKVYAYGKTGSIKVTTFINSPMVRLDVPCESPVLFTGDKGQSAFKIAKAVAYSRERAQTTLEDF